VQGKQKRYGKKSGLGFYKWENNKRVEMDRAGLEKIVRPFPQRAKSIAFW
jgi:3-hydroxyacyl-CoA dehydrogenase